MSCRMLDTQHITLNDTTQLRELCMSDDTKGGPAPKGKNCMDCKRLPL